MRLRVAFSIVSGIEIVALLSGFWQGDAADGAVEEGNRLYDNGNYAAALDR